MERANGTNRPCENYVTSSGTGGSTLVWDIRNPSATMNVLEHDGRLIFCSFPPIANTP